MKHVRSNVKLPAEIPLGGFPDCHEHSGQRTCIDPFLTDDEILDNAATVKGGRLYAGGILLVDELITQDLLVVPLPLLL